MIGATYYKSFNKKQVWALGILLITFIFFILSICFLKSYIAPPLNGTWVSTETGETITFKLDGTVDFPNVNSAATYKIIKPDLMEYTIDSKTFIMSYSIEGRTLSWGIKGTDLEVFDRR